MPELLATVDVGTNTAHLLLSHITDKGEAFPIHSETRFVRLGQGVDATGEIQPAALERLREVLSSFGAIAKNAGAGKVVVAGTSASRDARDPEALIRFVKNETGLDYQIISGEEEALLTGMGAMSGVDWKSDSAVIVDIGGGSTELTRVTRQQQELSVAGSISIDVGSVRITERCFSRLPPTRDEIDHARKIVMGPLDGVAAVADPDSMVVGAAGTIRAIAMVDAGVASWSLLPAGDVVVTAGDCRRWFERLQKMDYGEILALNPTVLQGRADVLTAGILILDCVFTVLEVERCVVSARGLRHGLAIRYASLKKARGG